MTPDLDAKRVAFHGRLDAETYIRADALASRSLGMKGTKLSTLCLVAGVAFLLLALLADTRDGALSWMPLSLGAFGAAWLFRDQTREQWRKDPVLRAFQSGWVDDGGIQTQRESQESRMAWDAFTGYARAGDLLVLFQGPMRCLPFSRDLFGDDSAWEDFLALVDSHLYLVSGPPEEKSFLARKAVWMTLLIAFLLSVLFALWNSWQR